MGKRGPKKRTDLDAVWKMRKLMELHGLSRRSAAKVVADGKPYTWETLRKAYAELEEAGELPESPPVSPAHEEAVRRTFLEWRERFAKALAARDNLSERLGELGIDPTDLATVDLLGLSLQLLQRQENLPLATAPPPEAAYYATHLHDDEDSALAAIQAERVEYEGLAEKRRLLGELVEARNTIDSLDKKLNPESG